MRRLIPLLSLLVVSLPARAQYGHYGPPAYSLERWEEDYSYLKNPANRSDLFDPIKYVPLSSDRDWYLTFGGQARERYDYFNNTNFGAGPQDEDGFRLTRLLAHVDARFGSNFRAYVQIDSSLANDRLGGPRPGDADDLDLQQAFGDVTLALGDAASAVVRVGRQELIYGAQRLVSPNDWGNVRRSFDGAKVSLSFPNDALEFFWTRPVVVEKGRMNGDDGHTWFAGIYNVTALPALLPAGHSKLDLYLLALDRSKSRNIAVDSDIYTTGTRFHTTPTPWDFDVEADGQFGKYGGAGVWAWALAAEAGYTFSKATFSPRAFLGFDSASGSPNAAHRFNQLFPPQYLYLGHMYVLGRQNIVDLHPGLAFNLTHGVTLSLDQHFFWRQNTHDAVYNLNGGVVRAPGGSHAAFVGQEFDAVVNWQIQRHLSAYLGYAHFFTGPFIDQTGPHSDMDFFYTAVTFGF